MNQERSLFQPGQVIQDKRTKEVYLVPDHAYFKLNRRPWGIAFYDEMSAEDYANYWVEKSIRKGCLNCKLIKGSKEESYEYDLVCLDNNLNPTGKWAHHVCEDELRFFKPWAKIHLNKISY